jgi:eukaryotic-like serine/threonine-protein kinase
VNQANTLRIFEQAIALEGAERDAFINASCGDNEAMRAEVRALLDADAAAGEFLAKPLHQTGDRSGERLGPYRLVSLIGSGGMGTVYRAERADGAFAKPVAIKLLMFDAGDLRQRFALEQRVQGALSHPNIASLLDAGRDANGSPYLVMEFVEGRPFNVYVKEEQTSLRDRVRLFLKILDAVQTAHGQLIVHRDIKPGNVLVDAHGEPKLLDFGIAKLIGDNQPSATRTRLGPLTPEYASPEQVRGDPIGIGSDVYSLGVMLFELITGERPYVINTTRASQIERIVCETEPARPSAALDSRRMGGSARDLDAIILKALAKTPARRYASCALFAEDLQRWLDHKEVIARQPPWSERVMRTLRRYRLIAAVSVTALVTLIAGSAVALWQAHIAREQAQIARAERDRAQRINQFLTDTLASANPADLGRKATVVQVLDRARHLADKEFANDPQSAANAQLVLARSFRALGDFDAAQACATTALKAAREHGDIANIIEAESTLGNVYFDKSNLPLARASFERAYDIATANGTPSDRAGTAIQLGLIENEEGNPAKAKVWLEKGLADLPPDEALVRASALDSEGYSASILGDKEGAIALRQKAIDTVKKKFPNGHPVIASFSVNLAQAYQRAGRNEEALALLNTVLPIQVETLGENTSDVIWTLTTITSIERKLQRFDDATTHANRAYEIALKFPDDNDWKAYAFEKYGEVLTLGGHPAEAIPVLEKALVIDRKMLPADHQSIASVEGALAVAKSKVDGHPVDVDIARAAYERLRVKYGEANEFTAAAKSRVDLIEALPAK